MKASHSNLFGDSDPAFDQYHPEVHERPNAPKPELPLPSMADSTVNTKLHKKYRRRAKIISDILQAAMGGAPKTRIMAKVSLSRVMLEDYLEHMVQTNLLEYSPQRRLYIPTERGLQCFGIYSQIVDFLSSRK